MSTSRMCACLKLHLTVLCFLSVHYSKQAYNKCLKKHTFKIEYFLKYFLLPKLSIYNTVSMNNKQNWLAGSRMLITHAGNSVFSDKRYSLYSVPAFYFSAALNH